MTTNYWHRVAAASMVAGPLCIGAANLLGVNQIGTNEQTLQWVGGHPGEYLLGVVCFLAGLALQLAGGLRIATARRQAGAGLARVGGSFFLVGQVAMLVTMSVYLLTARLITAPGVDPAAALAIKNTGDEDAGMGAFILVSLLSYVGLLVLAAALLRERAAPGWVVSVFVVSTLMQVVVAFTGAATAVIEAGVAFMLVGLVPMAWYSLTRWDVPTPAVSTPMRYAGNLDVN